MGTRAEPRHAREAGPGGERALRDGGRRAIPWRRRGKASAMGGQGEVRCRWLFAVGAPSHQSPQAGTGRCGRESAELESVGERCPRGSRPSGRVPLAPRRPGFLAGGTVASCTDPSHG